MSGTLANAVGIVAILEINEFVDPTVDILDYVDEGAIERIDPRREFDWRRITAAVRRQGEFAIESDGPEFKAHLRFSPQTPKSGDYMIDFKPRGPHEVGTTWNVSSVDPNRKHRYLAALAGFPLRFLIVTARKDRARYHRVWVIGLHELPVVSEDDL